MARIRALFRWRDGIAKSVQGGEPGMRMLIAASMSLSAAAALAHVPPADIAPAIYTDPPHDKAHPPGMEVLHIPSGGVAINGVAYTAAGAGPHPVLVLMHGLPGNEKNLDLA